MYIIDLSLDCKDHDLEYKTSVIWILFSGIILW